LAVDLTNPISGVEEEAKKSRQSATYFYDAIKTGVVKVERAFRVIHEEISLKPGKGEWEKCNK
jgi:hypothetical protein